jgi:tetratricopeptide (TPR) repeat protein
MRRPADAIRYFELAIEHDPNDFESLYNLAQIVKDQRGAAVSLSLFERAVTVGRTIEPTPRSFYDALFGYGATLHELGRIEDATQVLREYLTNAPSSAVDREEARELMQVIGQGQMQELEDEGD